MPRNPATNERLRVESRAQLLLSAAQLFADQGYFNTKISDIARAAGMSQGSLYWYFMSKEEVLQAILQDGFSTYGNMLASATTLPGSARVRLDALIDRSIALFSSQEYFFAILLSLMSHGGTELLNKLHFDMAQIGLGYHNHILPVLAQAQEEGLIARADPNWQAVCFFSYFNGLLLTYRNLFPHLPPESIRAAVYGMLGASGPMEPNT